MKHFYSYQALKRRLFIIGVISLLLALALELYTFGTPSGFFLRLLRTYFVIFILTSVSALGIIPGVSWAVNKASKL